MQKENNINYEKEYFRLNNKVKNFLKFGTKQDVNYFDLYTTLLLLIVSITFYMISGILVFINPNLSFACGISGYIANIFLFINIDTIIRKDNKKYFKSVK